MLFSCAGPYGRCHYGASGLFEVSRYGGGDGNPRISAIAYATMTKMLDGAKFVRWYPTGSYSSFCLLFNRKFNKGEVFALWTIRGKRKIRMYLRRDLEVKLTDLMGNSKKVKSNGRILQFEINTSPLWVENLPSKDLMSISLGNPVYKEKPDEKSILISDFRRDNWRIENRKDTDFEENNLDLPRFPGKMKIAKSEEGLKIELEKLEKERKLAPFYSILMPQHPIKIPGKPRIIGFYVKGNSGWGRIIPQFVDSKGEIWTFIGPKDEWNSDDIHSWSSINFDGWKYMEIELPYTFPCGSPGPSNSWWKSEKGDGIVDFPLTLTKIFIEQRTHIWYVNKILKVEKPEITLREMYISYRDPYENLKLTENW